MSQADRDSRLTITTNTGGGGYYDQVLALSAHVVNDGWKQLWEDYQDPGNEKITLKRIDIDTKDLGSIHAETLPCTVSFEGSNHEGISVYYFINVKTGHLKNADGSLDEDMTGWRLCVNVKVGEQKMEDMTPDQQKYINDNYNVPGDYSIARLFADLSLAYFDNLDPSRSTFGTDASGNPITWDDWLDAHSDDEIITIFYAFMSTWKHEMVKKGYSTLGVKVVIPDMKDQDPLDPTYPPTSMLHQGFKYKNDNTDKKIAEEYNCLMYCEQIMGHDNPAQTFIADGGNWCYPEANGNPAVHGTFAISSEIFYERVNGLREHVRPLAALSEISLKEPTIDGWGGRLHLYDVGHNPEHEDPNDSYFFAVKDDGNHQYIWTKTWSKEKGNSGDGVYWYCTHTSVQTVTLSWKPGHNRINLTGSTTYSYESSDWKDSTRQDQEAVLKESYTAAWDAPIIMTTDDDGRLTLQLEKRPEDTTVGIVQNYSTEIPKNGWSRQNSPAGYEKDIQSALQKALLVVEKNIALIFQTTGQWIYPGNGVLYFRNPMFTNNGDVAAEVEYKSLGTKTQVPGPHPGASLSKYAKTKPNVKVISSQKDS